MFPKVNTELPEFLNIPHEHANCAQSKCQEIAFSLRGAVWLAPGSLGDPKGQGYFYNNTKTFLPVVLYWYLHDNTKWYWLKLLAP